MDVLPSARRRERIDNHRKARGEIREKWSVPEATGDSLVLEPEHEARFDSGKKTKNRTRRA